MIEEATVDAYGEAEQAVGFLTMLEEHLEVPFQTTILNVPVIVRRADITADEIVAVCHRRRRRQSIPILSLPLPVPRPTGWDRSVSGAGREDGTGSGNAVPRD